MEKLSTCSRKRFLGCTGETGQINQLQQKPTKGPRQNMTEEASNVVANLEGLAERHSIVLYNERMAQRVIGIVLPA